ncbi:MAG: lysozyme inhibitor LprI family protein [Alphaproteobacteria bacterium]
MIMRGCSWTPLLVAIFLLVPMDRPLAASFDCRKASRPIEKFICSSPELDAADGRMGDVYRRVNASFPLKGFVQVTQREFVAGFPYCMNGTGNRPSTGPAALRQCLDWVQRRIIELESYERAIVYTSAADRFTPSDLAVLVDGPKERRRVRMWGNWMPHAFEPKPFPDGSRCDLEEELKPVRGGFQMDGYEDVTLRFSEAEMQVDGHVMCSARHSIGAGADRRAT